MSTPAEAQDADFGRWHDQLHSSLSGDQQAQLSHMRAVYNQTAEQRDKAYKALSDARETIRGLNLNAKQAETILASAQARARAAEQFSEQTARALEDVQSSLRAHLGTFEKIRLLSDDVEETAGGIRALLDLVEELAGQRDAAIQRARAAEHFTEQVAKLVGDSETTLRAHGRALTKAHELATGSAIKDAVEEIRELHLKAEAVTHKKAEALKKIRASEAFGDRVSQIVDEAETTLAAHEHALSRARALTRGEVQEDSRAVIPRSGAHPGPEEPQERSE